VTRLVVVGAVREYERADAVAVIELLQLWLAA
jgi:hypothetical protein